LTYVTDPRLSDLVKRFGRDHAQAAWNAGDAAIRQISEIVADEKIPCEFKWVPGYLHAPIGEENAEEIKRLKSEAKLARELGFNAGFMPKVPLLGVPGIAFANQAKLHPSKYLAGLLKTLRREGCQVFENSEAEEIQVDPPCVTAGGHKISCRYVVIATHVPLQGATGTVRAALFQTKLASYSTYAVGAVLKLNTVSDASFWDTSTPYYYLRIDRRKEQTYAILGGADHKTGQARNPESHYLSVEKRLRKIFPDAQIDHRWSGQVVQSSDGLPYLGETEPHQFAATGFAGNGFTFGTLAAMMARDAFTGRKSPWAELFAIERKSLGRAAINYFKENKDYPYYMAKQLLDKPAARSLRGIPRGAGKIVLLDGARVAAFRDDKGKLTVKSAICPHMGCVVRWNDPEKTWDCPCHGSRFQATGAVMAGPAEGPLSDIKAK
jgi:glycine/D-amino acid oxidase-like deaminating enzyme/nitrite reductase/ring-hydroxylating ferredoxin subunit